MTEGQSDLSDNLPGETVQGGLVDLVVPVYNEDHVITRSIARLTDAITHRAPFPWRVVIVNNGSSDNTLKVAQRLAEKDDRVTVVHLGEKGRGRALRKSWMETDAEFSLYMDVDLSTDLEAIPRLVDQFHDGADLVTGNRLDPESKIERSLGRDILSRGYNWLIRMVLRTRLFPDAQCGFKGIRVATIRPLLPLVVDQNWFFDTELLVLAELAGLDVRSIPIRWNEDSDSRVNIPQTILQDLRGLARLRMTAKKRIRQWRKETGK